MEISKIIASSVQFQDFCGKIKKDVLSKSILLFCKDEFYSFEFAKMLAIAILNNGNQEENENFLKVQMQAHPDVKFFPEKDKLLVADSAKIYDEAFVKPVFSDKKIFIVHNINNSMESAQNKLLKILEEPPKNVYFVITCSNENLVLPTIKSRCNKQQLEKISNEQILKTFEGCENAKLVCALCDGQLGKAIELSNKKKLREYFESVLALFSKLALSKEVLAYANKVFSFKESLSQTLLVMSFIIEDMMFVKCGQEIKFSEYENEITKASEEFSYGCLAKVQEKIDEASEKLFYSANQTILFENLLLDILEVKYLCK